MLGKNPRFKINFWLNFEYRFFLWFFVHRSHFGFNFKFLKLIGFMNGIDCVPYIFDAWVRCLWDLIWWTNEMRVWGVFCLVCHCHSIECILEFNGKLFIEQKALTTETNGNNPGINFSPFIGVTSLCKCVYCIISVANECLNKNNALFVC